MTTPYFSIIVPTRNRGSELQTCLDAIYQQTFTNYQVLILDDGSSSAIRQQHQALLKNYDERFQWHEINASDSLGSGPAVVRNIGIETAQGDYLAFCDDDDCWHREDHLTTAAKALEKTQAQAYFSGMQIKNGQGQIIVEQQMQQVTHIALQQNTVIEGVHPLEPEQILLYPDYAHLNIMIVQRDLIKQIGGFWPHTRFAEDVDLFVRVCDQAKGILFRPDICATHFAPEKRVTESVSNQLSLQDKRLLEISVYQHLLIVCSNAPALTYARKSLAITEKMLTEELGKEGKKVAAKIFSGAAFSALPSLKWGLYSLFLRLK
ncbi:MAG: glycosyltransferase family 2 protein [Methylococcaceae bacterium]|nr:glycosyltransferase family 2 protein [Methylococcaceae bacterium]